MKKCKCDDICFAAGCREGIALFWKRHDAAKEAMVTGDYKRFAEASAQYEQHLRGKMNLNLDKETVLT